MNDFDEFPPAREVDTGLVGQGAGGRQLPDDAFVKRSPDILDEGDDAPLLGDGQGNLPLVEEQPVRPPILRSAMKGGRRKFLADADQRTTDIAKDQLREQGKQRDPKRKDLAKARKAMFEQLIGGTNKFGRAVTGKEKLQQAAVPQERRQFNRVRFGPEAHTMDFHIADAPDEIPQQRESDRKLWRVLGGDAPGSRGLFENASRIKTEDEQLDNARKQRFESAENREATQAANQGRFFAELNKSPADTVNNAFLLEKNFDNPFKHSAKAFTSDSIALAQGLNDPRRSRQERAKLWEQYDLMASSETNDTDAAHHARASGQTRAYSKGHPQMDAATGQAAIDEKTKKAIKVGDERADVLRVANNRGSALSRFFGGIGDFLSKILPGAQRMFGTTRDNRFEAAPGQQEARQLLREERDTFRREARAGKRGLFSKLFGRTAGSGRTRLPLGPDPEVRPSTREEYAQEQRNLAADPVPAAANPPAFPVQPQRPARAQIEEFPAVDGKSEGSLEVGNDPSLDGEEIKELGKLDDQGTSEDGVAIGSLDGVLDEDDQ